MKKRIIVTIVAMAMLMCTLVTACGNSSTDSESKGSGKDWSKADHAVIAYDEFSGNMLFSDANGGMTTAPDSINAKNGINVEYILSASADESSAALITGEIQGAVYTVNRLAFLWPKFKEAGIDVEVVYISNYSNGADGIIASSDIKNIHDLVGKKIGIPRFSEAQTIFEYYVQNSDLTPEEEEELRKGIVFFESPDEAANAFVSNKIDAAATWDPYIGDAETSQEMNVLFDTSMSNNLCVNALVMRKDFVEQHEDYIQTLIDGCFEAAPLYTDTSTFDRIRNEMSYLSSCSDDEILVMCERTTLANCAENKKLLSDTGKTIYTVMANIWLSLGETAYPEDADKLFENKFVSNLLESKYLGEEAGKDYSLSDEEKKYLIEEYDDSIFEYTVEINFEINSAELKEESKETLKKFIERAKMANNLYIVVEGNCSKRKDERIPDSDVIEFTEKRAQAVKDFFVENGIESERILIVGNGDSKLRDTENPNSAENRRTDIYFKEKLGM